MTHLTLHEWHIVYCMICRFYVHHIDDMAVYFRREEIHSKVTNKRGLEQKAKRRWECRFYRTIQTTSLWLPCSNGFFPVSSQCRPQSPRAQTQHLPKNGDEERREEIQNQANVIVLGLGDSVSDLQANLNLFPQKSQLIFSPRSRHSSHQHPSSYSLFSTPLSIIFFTCSNSEFDSDLWIFVLVNCVVAEGYWLKQSSMSPYAGMLIPFFFSNIYFFVWFKDCC